MKTELLYQVDSYLRAFDGRVVAVDGTRIALDRSAFYPGGGGQPHDTGTLTVGDRTFPVIGVRKEGDLTWHDVDARLDDLAETEGQRFSASLDWERRFSLMRTHSALHVLCGVVWRDYGAKVTGGNMQPLSGRMDFEFDQMRAELVGAIEEAINEEVERDRPISVRFLERSAADVHPDLIRTKVNLLPRDIERVRTVDIEGLDVQADGGTHVARTGEIGPIRVAGYKSKGKANKRIEIALEARPTPA